MEGMLQTHPHEAKPDKQHDKKEKRKQISLVNIDESILISSVCYSQTSQQYTKMIAHHDHIGFIVGVQEGFTITKINKYRTAHKQNKEQKSHDHLNRCRKFAKIIHPNEQSPEETRNRKNVCKNNKGYI
jgi:hypothetical protein